MAAKKSGTKTLAQERAAFLAEYLRVIGENHREIEPQRGVLNFTTRAAQMGEWLRRERLEMIRAVSEIGISHAWDDPLADDSPMIALGLREWQRAAQEVRKRVAAMRAFLKKARTLEELERVKQVIEQRGEGPAQRLAYGPNVPKLAEVTQQVYKLRDALTQQQPEIERLLRDVGQTLGDWSLAGGALGIIDLVADRINQAIGGYGRWPAQRGSQELKRAREPIDCAREVFAAFKQNYDHHLGDNVGVWWLNHDGEDDPDGLSAKEWRVGMALLLQKRLVKRLGQDERVLTDHGLEVCAHPHLLDGYLGPRGVAPQPVQHVQNNTINTQQLQNAQFGNHNTLNATYSTVLQQLVKEIEASDVEPAKKAAWLKTVDEIMAHPLTQTALMLVGTGVLQQPR